uniref:U-box domain-containing protein n=1 Tax=Rhabditophanes sp. KR3021 TaxID=114890 RepID=A0AC35TW87_9BILA
MFASNGEYCVLATNLSQLYDLRGKTSQESSKFEEVVSENLDLKPRFLSNYLVGDEDNGNIFNNKPDSVLKESVLEAYLMKLSLCKGRGDIRDGTIGEEIRTFYGTTFTESLTSTVEYDVCRTIFDDFTKLSGTWGNDFVDHGTKEIVNFCRFVVIEVFSGIFVHHISPLPLNFMKLSDAMIYIFHEKKVSDEKQLRDWIDFVSANVSEDYLKGLFKPIFMKLRTLAIDAKCYRHINFTNMKCMNKDLRWLPLILLTRLIILGAETKSRFNLVDVLCSMENFKIKFLGNSNHGYYECMASYLGPFFSLGIFENGDTERSPELKKMFGDVGIERVEKNDVFTQIRNSYDEIRENLKCLTQVLVCKPSTRKATTRFLVDAIGANYCRGKLQYSRKDNMGSSFTTNLVYVVVYLAAKVKLERLDYNYLAKKQCAFDLKDLTRINMNESAIPQYCETIEEGEEVTFNSLIFYIALFAIHIGYAGLINDYNTTKREYEYLKKDLNKHRAAFDKHRGSGIVSGDLVTTYMSYKLMEEQSSVVKYTLVLQMTLLHDLNINKVIYSLMDKWGMYLLNMIHPDAKLNHIPAQPNDMFKNLPEFMVDDLLATFQLLTTSEKLASSSLVFVQRLMSVLSVSPQYFRAPFTYAKLLEVIVQCWSKASSSVSQQYYQQILMSPGVCNKITPVLIKYYCDVESTGADTEFYDKFNIRRCIHFIFERFRESSSQKGMLVTAMNGQSNEIQRFANIVISDVSYLFDEVVGGMKKAVKLEKEIAAETANSNEADSSSRRLQFEEVKRGVSTWIYTLAESLDLLKKLTEYAHKIFLDQLIGEQLAALMNYNLTELSPPNHVHFESPTLVKELNFEGRNLVTKIITVYNCLSMADVFSKYVAADERSFTPEKFAVILKGLKEQMNFNGAIHEKFSAFVKNASVHYALKIEDEDFGEEIPEEFIDPIMGNIMLDPVLLPTSGQICDRKTIITSLLTVQKDPFNRQELTSDQLVPQDELRVKVENWICEMRAAKAAKLVADQEME